MFFWLHERCTRRLQGTQTRARSIEGGDAGAGRNDDQVIKHLRSAEVTMATDDILLSRAKNNAGANGNGPIIQTRCQGNDERANNGGAFCDECRIGGVLKLD